MRIDQWKSTCGVLAVASLSMVPTTQAWQMKQAAIMTDFAQQVDPNNPLPEYPRPRMVRPAWHQGRVVQPSSQMFAFRCHRACQEKAGN